MTRADQAEGTITDADDDELAAFWQDGVGTPRLAAPLPCEVRAIWHCKTCDRVLVGAKNGSIRIDGGAGLVRADTRAVRGSVRALVGCPACEGAWVGDQAGNVLRLTMEGGYRATMAAFAGDRIGRVVAMVLAGGRLHVHHARGHLRSYDVTDVTTKVAAVDLARGGPSRAQRVVRTAGWWQPRTEARRCCGSSAPTARSRAGTWTGRASRSSTGYATNELPVRRPTRCR